MSEVQKHLGNPLGDLRAETDHVMLDKAFYETPDYLSLIESNDKTLVVGRRGSGKSALAYHLSKYWYKVPKTRVVTVTLEEDQVIGLTPVVECFGERYRLIRAGCSIAWRYCLIMETALELSKYYKFAKHDESKKLRRYIEDWESLGKSASIRLRNVLKKSLSRDARPEERIGDLAQELGLTAIEQLFDEVSKSLGMSCVLLIDKLDEGYEPNEIGVGFVDGIIDAAITINKKYDSIRSILFLRDNMFRTIARWNPDFSRNIEGQELRLNWKEYDLMNMVANRLRVAFNITQVPTLKVWNRCSAKELVDRAGFKKCLQLTLYRPRDILVLLNKSFYEASKEKRSQIVLEDVLSCAKSISKHRLEDLHKEYSAIYPGLIYLTSAFANINPETDFSTACECLDQVLSANIFPSDVEQNFAILGSSTDALRALYGIGFIGIRGIKSDVFTFCHDGKSPDKEIAKDDIFLVHPCYWMALNASKDALNPRDAQEINDEYEITVKGESAELRNKKLNELISELGKIPGDTEGGEKYENWCLKSVSTLFAGALRHIDISERKEPKGSNCIIGLNLSRTDAWKRVYEDYQARNVMFIPLNIADMKQEQYWDAVKIMSEVNGRILFIINRDKSMEMRKDGELSWVRDIFKNTGIIVVKLTAKHLASLLGKIRNPQKHDAVDTQINGILDMYSRRYLHGSRRIKKVSKDNTMNENEKKEPLSINIACSACYGEIELDQKGKTLLRLFHKKNGPGKRSQICEPIKITDQAFRILQDGIERARRTYIETKKETSTMHGMKVSTSECEPEPEYTFELSWDKNDLARLLHNKDEYYRLQKKKKRAIISSMSRLRNIAKFSDGLGLVSESDETDTRYTLIRFRFRK